MYIFIFHFLYILILTFTEISTQIAEISRKGRDSQCCHPEISTQITEMCKKGREFQARGLEISTQMVNNTLSTQFFILQNR